MKKSAKRLIASLLGRQVRRLQKKHTISVIAVAGSTGKTSTKYAIATVLQEGKRVRFQQGNYNDVVTVPLIFFGLPEPSVMNPFAWLVTLITIERQLRAPYSYDVVVVELGTDGPGQIQQFAKFMTADISVITAISPEHMEYFADLQAVANEEMAVADFSRQILINSDLVDEKYIPVTHANVQTYAIHHSADYKIDGLSYSTNGGNFKIEHQGRAALNIKSNAISDLQVYSVAAAVGVASELGLSVEQITLGVAKIASVEGRLNVLKGIQQSVIIDDTYNASPQAMMASLDLLYRLAAPQKIAILGSMNELGKYSQPSHEEVGAYCDPQKLDAVITIGKDANDYLATAAEKQGCQVIRAKDASNAAGIVKSLLKPHATILAKGSQNGVFAEEAVKELLADQKDISKLVRQSDHWMATKQKLASENI